ncbi:MAG: hypothetical protein HQM02_08990, partial [Magnetococcales bacterium]|nr:hypothetical protein [Magnetococcales bacterium]
MPHERLVVSIRKARHAGHWLLAVCLVWSVCTVAAPAWGAFQFWPVRFKAQPVPWRVWGFSGFQLTSSMMKDNKSNMDHVSIVNANLSRGYKGYVWKPWVVQWNAMASVGANSTQRFIWASASGKDTNSDSLMRTFSGAFDVAVLPESRFPLKVVYNRTMDDSSEGEGNGGQANLRELIGLSQDYKNAEGDVRVALRLDHNRDLRGSKNHAGLYGLSVPAIDRNEGRFTSDTLSLGISKSFEEQTADLFLKRSVARSHFQGAKSATTDDSVVFNHTLTGGKVWSANSLGNYSRIQAAVTSSQREEAFLTNQQLGTSAFWRSEEMPLFFSGSIRTGVTTQQFSIGGAGNDGGGPSTNRTVSVITGSSYQFTPEMSLSGSMAANFQENESADKLTEARDIAENLSANYSPERQPLGAFMHNWFVSNGYNVRHSSGFKPNQSFNAGAGQTLMRDLMLGKDLLLNFSVNEVGFMNHTSRVKGLYGVNHSVNGRFTRMISTTKTYVDLSLTDTRALGDEISSGQALNTQLSAEGVVLKGSNWKGHLTTQSTRGVSKGKLA